MLLGRQTHLKPEGPETPSAIPFRPLRMTGVAGSDESEVKMAWLAAKSRSWRLETQKAEDSNKTHHKTPILVVVELHIISTTNTILIILIIVVLHLSILEIMRLARAG